MVLPIPKIGKIEPQPVEPQPEPECPRCKCGKLHTDSAAARAELAQRMARRKR
jgi:hypothetical protein